MLPYFTCDRRQSRASGVVSDMQTDYRISYQARHTGPKSALIRSLVSGAAAAAADERRRHASLAQESEGEARKGVDSQDRGSQRELDHLHVLECIEDDGQVADPVEPGRHGSRVEATKEDGGHGIESRDGDGDFEINASGSD